MTTTITPPPSTEEKPWIWTSLGTAALIVLCCGIAPVVAIAGIEAARDSASSSAGKGGAIVAKPSPHTSPHVLPPSAAPAPVPTPTPSLDPAPPLERPDQGPPAEALPAEEPPVIEGPSGEGPPPQIPLEPIEPVQPPVTDAPAAPPQEVTLPQPPALIARIGDIVRVGGLEFVVREVKCGLKQVGTVDSNEQAQGHFCVVTISVKNIGQLTQSLLESAQRAVGANGSEYGTDPAAGLVVNGTNQGFLSGIDPGEEVSGFVVFELPEGINLAEVILPGGVKVIAG